jgi:hypothetical protein
MQRFTMRTMVLGALAISLGGCKVDQDGFAADFPTAYCQRQQDCREGSTPDGGSSELEECKEEWAEYLVDVAADKRCEYDGSSALQCLQALEDSDCDENTAIYYECKGAWSESKDADDGDDEDECAIDTEEDDDTDGVGDTAGPGLP